MDYSRTTLDEQVYNNDGDAAGKLPPSGSGRLVDGGPPRAVAGYVCVMWGKNV
jgi:hypothetical protein